MRIQRLKHFIPLVLLLIDLQIFLINAVCVIFSAFFIPKIMRKARYNYGNDFRGLIFPGNNPKPKDIQIVYQQDIK